MNIPKIFEMQAILEAHVKENHPPTKEENRFSDKSLALMTELGECANEWRKFKFWSDNREPNKEKLLEEFADCLHLIVSIGLDLGADPLKQFIPVCARPVTSETFLSVKQDVLTLDLRREKDHYNWTFTCIMDLGLGFGFTTEQIEQAYYSKNKINHARQENNY